jgi:hypothetical protein
VNVEAFMGVALIAIWRSVSEVFDVSAEPGRAMGTGTVFCEEREMLNLRSKCMMRQIILKTTVCCCTNGRNASRTSEGTSGALCEESRCGSLSGLVNHLRFTGRLRFPMSRAIAYHSWRNGEAARNREVLLTPKLPETLRD